MALAPMASVQVSTALLASFMVYDIFMVFISPLIFKSSVMVTVAQVVALHCPPMNYNSASYQ